MFGNWQAYYTLAEMYRNHPVTTEATPFGAILMTTIFCLALSVFMVWIMNEETKTLSNKEGE